MPSVKTNIFYYTYDILIYIYYLYIHTCTCQGVPLWHPLGRGCQNGAPLFQRCFSTCFGSSGIYISSLLSEATEAMLLSSFLAPQKWRVSNVSFACRGDVQGVPKRHPFRLRGVVLAPLNACRQGLYQGVACHLRVGISQNQSFCC